MHKDLPGTLRVVVHHRELAPPGADWPSAQTPPSAVALLSLGAVDGTQLPSYTAGAHIDLHLPAGLVRAYSLCGDPRERDVYRIAVQREPSSRGGSAAVHQTLQPGTELTIGRPRNHFELDQSAPYSVLVGGGIGVTPLVAMGWALWRADRPFELHYCVRSRQHAALANLLAATPWADRVQLHVDPTSAGGTRWDPLPSLRAAPPGSHVYTCGPSGFMDWVTDQGRAAGLAASQIHREYFAAPVKIGESPAIDTSFEVVARASGKQVLVAANQSILNALREAGIRVPVSCLEGVCGSCVCTVLEGEPEHRDTYLTQEEKAANDQILVCCSRARGSRLVLDV